MAPVECRDSKWLRPLLVTGVAGDFADAHPLLAPDSNGTISQQRVVEMMRSASASAVAEAQSHGRSS